MQKRRGEALGAHLRSFEPPDLPLKLMAHARCSLPPPRNPHLKLSAKHPDHDNGDINLNIDLVHHPAQRI